MNYTLNSLHLGTEFDTKVQPLTVPGVARLGSEPALSILDGANRAPRRLARLVKPVALLGLKVAAEDGVRVTVVLQSDRQATAIWNRVYSKFDEEPVLENELAHHRLVEVTAQGHTRGVLMLALRKADKGRLVQRLTFDIQASEIGASGLLMVGFEEPAEVPEWATEGLLETSLVGMCVTSIKLEPIGATPVRAQVSGGRPPEAPVNVQRHPGFFLVNPGPEGGPLRLTLKPRLRSARGRGGLMGRLRAAGAHSAPNRKPDELPPVEVEVLTIGGVQVFQGLVENSADAYHLELPPVAEPLFVRATPGSGNPRLRGFKVQVSQV